MKFILNSPWTLIGILVGLISIPTSAHIERGALVVNVRSLWLPQIFLRGVCGLTIGNTILLGRNKKAATLEHEFVHIEQLNRYPFIFPFVYALEFLRHGYRQNRFEDEAYGRTKV